MPKRVRSDRLHVKAARRFGSEDGFTLIELLIVMGILVLIAGLAAPQVIKYLGSAKTKTATTQIQNLVGAVELYRLDVSSYPPKSQGLAALLTAPPSVDNWNGPYIRKSSALVDPWGRDYIYRAPGERNPFDIQSLGRDGKEGGEGEDADIHSW